MNNPIIYPTATINTAPMPVYYGSATPVTPVGQNRMVINAVDPYSAAIGWSTIIELVTGTLITVGLKVICDLITNKRTTINYPGGCLEISADMIKKADGEDFSLYDFHLSIGNRKHKPAELIRELKDLTEDDTVQPALM